LLVKGRHQGTRRRLAKLLLNILPFARGPQPWISDNDVEIRYRKLKEIFNERAPEPKDADPGAVHRMKVLFTVLNTYGKHVAREGILDYDVWLSAERFGYKIRQSTQVYHLCYLAFRDIFSPVIDLNGKCHHEWIGDYQGDEKGGRGEIKVGGPKRNQLIH
jgi:hypothetical protein